MPDAARSANGMPTWTLLVRQTNCFAYSSGHCPDDSSDVTRTLRGHEPAAVTVSDYLRTGRGLDAAADIVPDILPDAPRLLRDLLPHIHVRGWCLAKITAFPFQKAATDSVRPNVSKFVRGCADDNALNGRSETGSETKQVGSRINERRRS